jgi:hypothetical protein
MSTHVQSTHITTKYQDSINHNNPSKQENQIINEETSKTTLPK